MRHPKGGYGPEGIRAFPSLSPEIRLNRGLDGVEDLHASLLGVFVGNPGVERLRHDCARVPESLGHGLDRHAFLLEEHRVSRSKLSVVPRDSDGLMGLNADTPPARLGVVHAAPS